MASGSVRYPVPEGERWTEEAVARLVGKAVIVNGEPGGTVTSARIGSDGWIELDMEFTGQDWDTAPLGSSLVTSLSTGLQWVEPPPAQPADLTRWFPG